MEKSKNELPPLPDDIIETVRQYISEDDDHRWRLGDYLTDVVNEITPLYSKMGVTYPRASLFRQIANLVGCDTSTLRDRQIMSTFYSTPIRQEYSALSWSQLRACKAAGPEHWREYADWALLNLPAPVTLLRARIKHDGHLPPLWVSLLDRFIDIAWSLERDESAPGWVRQAAHFVVEASKEWKE